MPTPQQNHSLGIFVRTTFGLDPNIRREPHVTVSQAIASFVCAIQFAVERPDAERDITKNIPAEIGKNTFYWLTTNEVSSEDEYKPARVVVLPDGIAHSAYTGSSTSKSPQEVSAVKVQCEVAPAERAMDVALRLWDIFRSDRIGFTAERAVVTTEGDTERRSSEPSLTVHRVRAYDEPQIAEIQEDGTAIAVFGLHVYHTRQILH